MKKESVWDYPRPPRVEPTSRRIRVYFAGLLIADSTRALRVLETSHPPVYYMPPADVRMDLLEPTPKRTFCEFKGTASYWTLRTENRQAQEAAWSYAKPTPGFEALAGYLAFYASRVDQCFVDEELVVPQAGSFYGGWITADIDGPFKG
ncbi:MAG: DUF427 domain-containing protein [Acidobacteria bacterium]|nr:DUF427 domain-containing protein [Acidobacteriota bacterium]